MLFTISAKNYVFLFIATVLVGPAFIFLPLLEIRILYWGLVIVNALVLTFVGFYNSSSRLSFLG